MNLNKIMPKYIIEIFVKMLLCLKTKRIGQIYFKFFSKFFRN